MSVFITILLRKLWHDIRCFSEIHTVAGKQLDTV